MPAPTTNYGLLQPLVSSPTDQDLWGGYLNTTIGSLDTLMLTAMNFATSPETANFSVSAPTTGSAATGSAKALFLCDATSGAIAADLPAASTTGNGFTVAFKKTDSGANAVTVTPNNADTIDDEPSFALSNQNSWVILVSDGAGNWNVISDFASTVGLPTLAGTNAFTGANSFSVSPTVPTPSANDSSTKAATTAFANPGSSLGSSGYQKFPSGLILQWGSISSAGGVVNFPLAFPNNCFSVVITPFDTAGSNNAAWTVNAMGKTSFTARVGYNSVGGLWMATGN